MVISNVKGFFAFSATLPTDCNPPLQLNHLDHTLHSKNFGLPIVLSGPVVVLPPGSLPLSVQP